MNTLHTFILSALLLISSAIQSESNLHRYMWASYNQFSGNKQQAMQWYNEIFSTPNPSIYTNKGYIHLLSESGNYQRITELMPKLADLFKNDPDVQLIFVTALRKTGKITEADDLLVRLSQSFKTHPEIIFHATETLIKKKELTNALAVIDSFLNNTPKRANNFIFYFLKSQIYTQLNDYNQALASIKLCLKAHPRFPQGWLLMAVIEEQAGKLDKAIEGYSSYLEINGTNKNIEQHVLGLVFKQKSLANNKQVILVNKSCFDKALILFERKEYKFALQQIDICLSQNPQDAQYRLLKVQIMTAMKDYPAVANLITIWSSREADNQLWLQVLHLMPRVTNDYASIIASFEKIHAAQPNQLLPALYLADLYTRTKQSDKALTYHTKALALTQDAGIKTRILFQIGLSHYEQEHYAPMAKALEHACSLGEYPPALNLLAYYYASETNNYAQAQALIDKALAHDKNNPHFKDTQALILYKQKRYPQALAILEEIRTQIPGDSTALIHLAKTHYKMGNTSQALNIMHDAEKHAHNPYEKKTSALLLSQWNK